MVTPRQNSLILLNIDAATSQELPETHIEPSLQLEASAYLDHGIHVPTVTLRDGARGTLLCSGTKQPATPHVPGRSRIRADGFSEANRRLWTSLKAL